MTQHSEDEYQAVKKAKNNAYWERNQLVAAFSKLFPSHLAKHPAEDKDWDDDWRTIVVVYVYAEDAKKFSHNYNPQRTVMSLEGRPFYQLTWHIHDQDVSMFDHLSYQPILTDGNMPDTIRGNSKGEWGDWDGHSTEEKYRRLRQLTNGAYVMDPKEFTEIVGQARAEGRNTMLAATKNIVERELNPLGLGEMEEEHLIDPVTSKSSGYPKTEKARQAVDEIVQAHTAYMRRQILNTSPDSEVGEPRDSYGSEKDKRVVRV